MKNFYKIRLCFALIIFLLSCIAFCGWFYPVHFLDYQFVPLFQRVLFDFSVIALLGLIGILLITYFFGRFYCSCFCVLGITQEVGALVFEKLKRKPVASKCNYGIKYLIMALCFGSFAGGSAVIIRYLEPYTIFGASSTPCLYGRIIGLVILLLVFFKNRFFCTNICPVGACLGLISKLTFNKIYMKEDVCVSCGKCERNCPAGCINSKEKFVENETCVKCLRCVSICPKNAMVYGRNLKKEIK